VYYTVVTDAFRIDKTIHREQLYEILVIIRGRNVNYKNKRQQDAVLPPLKDTNISLLPYTTHSSPTNNYLVYDG